MAIVVYHNPDCGTSRNVLRIMSASGDEQLLAAMVEHPVLVNRPIVCTPRGVRLGRPSEAVLDLLDRQPAGPFYKDDGELVIEEEGRRVV